MDAEVKLCYVEGCGEPRAKGQSRCRKHSRQQQREWRAKNPELRNQQARAGYAKNRAHYRQYQRERRAKNLVYSKAHSWWQQNIQVGFLKDRQLGKNPRPNPKAWKAANWDRLCVLMQRIVDNTARCQICGAKNWKMGNKLLSDSLVVDHNHKTFEIRGILCRPCNTAEGYVNAASQRSGATPTTILRNLSRYIRGLGPRAPRRARVPAMQQLSFPEVEHPLTPRHTEG